MKLVPFSIKEAQELLDKLKDNTFYDGKYQPSLCIAKMQTEQKMRKQPKKLKVSEVHKVENKQKMHNMQKEKNKPQKLWKASQEADTACTSSFQQSARALSSLGMHKKEFELYQLFIRITQMIAEMLVDSSQNQHCIVDIWIDTYKNELKTTNIDFNISLISDICFV